ncbi:exo-alpha-sialidase [Nocardia arthritidis]|uniref:Sialidase domain-containing protein n=1 Tax=Nocardia arthritidis TaxID=228602 RepID=A0A6G9Y9E4_9NOCA|nr:exo-alpha-sialidase [Nocardia arthritidis]QIS09740.1 hypothetical protein F5544_09195 [Nocardia arthritidis]
MPLYMAWRGSLEDQGLYWAQCENGQSWSDQQLAVGGSADRPTLASWQGRLYMAWRGIGSDDSTNDKGLYWASFDGRQWSEQQRIEGVASNFGPSLVATYDRLHLYWKGSTTGDDTDDRIYHSIFDGTAWSPQQVLFDGHEITNHAPSVTSTHTSRVWMAVKGRGADQSITLFYSSDGVSWNFGDAVRGPDGGTPLAPSVIGRATFGGGDDRLLLTWVSPDSAVHCATSEDSGRHWSSVNIPATSNGIVGLAAWGSADAYAVWRGDSDDHNLYWADTEGGTTWFDPLTNAPLAGGDRLIPFRASVVGPAMAAYGTMWK